MSLFDALSVVLSFFFVVWFLVSSVKLIRKTWLRLAGRFTRRIDFGLADVPLSAEQWQRFCALAHARGISQKRLLADCVMFYFAEKVK